MIPDPVETTPFQQHLNRLKRKARQESEQQIPCSHLLGVRHIMRIHKRRRKLAEEIYKTLTDEAKP